MEKKIEDISKELDNFVQIKELELSDVVKDAPAIISALEEGFIKLKALIADYEFQEKAEEINFFKETKPKLFCKLIYYRKIYNIEINRPMCSYHKQITYLENEQDQLYKFSERNIEFIQYYRSGKTILDEYYFLRGRWDMELNLESFYFERDPKFSTNFDFNIAMILANDMLAAYLNCELGKIKREEYNIDSLPLKSNIEWTDKKSALVELIYAVHSEKSINFGNIDLKVLAALCEKMFNIKLGDIYRIFLEIRGRKGERSVYLQKLIEALNRRMDDADSK